MGFYPSHTPHNQWRRGLMGFVKLIAIDLPWFLPCGSLVEEIPTMVERSTFYQADLLLVFRFQATTVACPQLSPLWSSVNEYYDTDPV